MSNIFTRLLLNTDGFNKNLYKAQKDIKGFAATSKAVFGGLTTFTSYAAAFVGISTSIHTAVTANMEFEKSLSSLRSLTGVSAEELNYFRAEAIKMAMDSTQSATQMVDAYKLIGSQMPELLKNKTALTQVANAAVTLAEAAELDVPTAAKALTGSLNQMGESSSHAAEYINILAAASQQGSADIPYLNKAVENAGGAASSCGIKFNELVASIEAIAPKITDAASAGTNLRNIFLTLESSSDNNLRPSVVGLSKALDNLSAKNLDAVAMTKMFGKESVTAALALMSEKDAFDKLKVSITDTNTAYDQAFINTDNLAGSIDKLTNSWNAFINSMSNSNGILNKAVLGAKYWVDQLNRINMSEEDRKKFDNKNNFQDDANKSLERLRKRIDSSVKNGMSQDEAIDKELRMLKNFFPEALKYEQRINELNEAREKIGGKYEKYWTADRKKAVNDAEKNLKISEKQKYVYDYLYENLKAQKQELIDKNKAEEEAVKKAKEAALAEAAQAAAEEKKKYPEGSQAWLDKKISEKRTELSLAVSDEDRIRISRELDELISKKREMEITIRYKDLNPPDKAKEYTSLSSMASIPEGWDKIGNIGSTGIKNQVKDINEYYNAVSGLSTALGNLGSAFDESSQNVFSYFSSVISGAAQAAVAISALIPIKKAEANANMEAAATGVASSVAPIPFVGAAMAVGAIMSLIAAIATIPKFEKGGIVGGSSFFGDKLLARVNSGEMILNRGQQKNLYRLTENGKDVRISFDKVRGADIYLALSNYMKKTGKKL